MTHLKTVSDILMSNLPTSCALQLNKETLVT